MKPVAKKSFGKLKSFYKKIKNKIKTFSEAKKDKVDKIKAFILIVLGYGLILNYTLLIIFHVPFKWYGFPAYGIFYYFTMEEFVTFFRKLKARTQS